MLESRRKNDSENRLEADRGGWLNIDSLIKLWLAVLMVFTCSGNMTASLSEVEAQTLNDDGYAEVTFDVTYSQTQARTTFLSLINELRTSKGVSELEYDYGLEEESMRRAAELVILFDHRSPTGKYNFGATSENIAYCFSVDTDVEDAFDSWCSSTEGHYENMYYSKYKYMSLGVVTIGYSHYFCLSLSKTAVSTEETTANDSLTSVTVEYNPDLELANFSKLLCSNHTYLKECICSMFGHTVVESTYVEDEENNLISYTCDVCGEEITESIYADISDSDNGYSYGIDASSTTFTYTGSAIEPDVYIGYTYKDMLTEGEDYEVTYYNNTDVGTAIAAITGIGDYCGTVYVTFTIEPVSIKYQAAVSAMSFTYTGKAIEPEIVFTGVPTDMIEGTDYTVEYSDNTEVGKATAVVTGIGNYTDSRTLTFTIKAADISTAEISVPDHTYTGSAIEPTDLIVTWNDMTLEEGTDYEIYSYSNNTNIGTATVEIQGMGNFSSGSYATGTFSIVSNGVTNSLSNATVTLSSTSYTYNGSAKKPTPTVKLNGTKLTKGTDYTVSYSNNTNAGTATVTVTGIGNYTGSVSKTFTISARSLSSASVSLSSSSYTYDGSAKKPTPTVKVSGTTLTKGTDYTVSYSSNTNAGTATVTVTGIGNYTGSVSKTFTISARSLSSATVSLSSSSYTYNGSAKKPTPTVKVDGTTLTKGTDYTVSYSSNTNAGTATVKITGTDNYTGSVSKTFTISQCSISKATASSISNKTYTGSAIKPTVTLKYNGKTLTKGTDYTVKYSSNKSTGKATITITGTGTNFTGTKKVYFYIVPKKVTISSVKSTKTKTLTVKYKKATGASGYQIAYRKKGTSTWKYKTVSSSSLSKKITGLKKKTNYQVKVRAYKTVSSKKYYGSWSTTKTVKTK